MAEASSRLILKRKAWRTTPKARWCSLKAPCPVKKVQVQVRTAARTTGSRRAMTALRRLKARNASSRAALTSASCGGCKPCSTCMWRRRWPSSSARWKRRCGTWARFKPEQLYCGRLKARPGAIGTARGMSVRYVAKKGKVLVGFHERQVELCGRHAQPARCYRKAGQCPVGAAARAGERTFDQRDRVPQIEVAVGDEARRHSVLRHLEPLS